MQDYSCKIGRPLLFAVFWRKQCIWTVNSIEVFSEKSSGYKISYSISCANDLSAIFGDYTYLFRKQCYRKSVFSKSEESDTEYVYSHEKHGKTLMDAVSLDGRNYTQLNLLETPLLDCAFDFQEIKRNCSSDLKTEIIEQYAHFLYIYKLSSLILAYLNKVCCWDKETMYYDDNVVVREVFKIVDTVRRKCGGEIFYLIPHDINKMSTKLFKLQFRKTAHIFEVYTSAERSEEYNILASHT